MKFKLLKELKSLLVGLEWDNIPDFAIITGKNGTGKSHLLEAMNNQDNWEGRLFLKKDIKYIPPMHKFINTANTTRSQYMQLSDQRRSEALATFKNLQTNLKTPHAKEFQKSNNVDFRELASLDMSELQSRYSDIIKGNSNIASLMAIFFANKSSFLNVFEKTSPKKIEEITDAEFGKYFFSDTGNEFTDSSHLKRWFTAYCDDFRKRSAEVINDRDDTVRKELENEKKPWVLMNEILSKHNFKYQIENFNPNIDPVVIKFINTDDNTTVPIEELSSGEQQIISLVAWAHHEIISQSIKLLLLDEPDAHLHPSFCKTFIDIMNEYVVEKHKIKVIMTTHSPSTIAYAPSKSIFVMNDAKSEKSRIEKQDKDTALGTLSDGLMTLQEGGKILNKIYDDTKCVVFVEGESDVIHFESACKKLNKEDLGLQFISGYGLDRLEPFLKGCPYNLLFDKTVIGIFDNDKRGQESFNSFNKDWENHNVNENIMKKKNNFNTYIMKLPLLKKHHLFYENTIERYYSDDVLKSQNMVEEELLKGSNENDSKCYKLCKQPLKIKFAQYCETLDAKEFENFKEIFFLIETIISRCTSTK